MSSPDIGLKTALSGIEGGKQKERTKGLDDVIYIFRNARDSRAGGLTKPLDDKGFHAAFEALFHCALSEKQIYYGGKTSAKSAAANEKRLEKCAEALRLAIEYGAPKLKRKTLLAVIDHIIQTLPGPGGDNCEPLFQDYVKALCALVSHAPNVEILATTGCDGWLSCVDFTVQTIHQYLDGLGDDPSRLRGSPAPGISHSASLSSSSLNPASVQRKSALQKGSIQDFLQCLHCLARATNAPLIERADDMSSVVVQILRLRFLSLSGVQQLGFAVLNAILVAVQTDCISRASSLTMDILPLIRQWWQANAVKNDALLNGVRTEILNTMFNIHLQLEYLFKQDSHPTLLDEIETLADFLWSEYARRDERGQLQQDDLSYPDASLQDNLFCSDTFVLRPFNSEGERKWAIVDVMAHLEGILWKASQSAPQPHNEDGRHPKKRQRKTSGLSRFRQRLRSRDHFVQQTALQVLPYLIPDLPIDVGEMSELLSFLTETMSNKKTRLSTWAMISCASIISQSTSRDESLSPLWKQAWQLATRAIGMASTCRAACFLLNSILTHGLVAYRDISDDISGIVMTADVNGPAVAVDSSFILMRTLLRLLNHQLPNASLTMCNGVVRWMFLRWDPADSAFITSSAMHCGPRDAIKLLQEAYGHEKPATLRSNPAFTGSLGETLGLLHDRNDMVRYLLLLQDTDRTTRNTQDSGTVQPTSQPAEIVNSRATRRLVAELFYPKLEEVETFCKSWSIRGEGSSQVTQEKLQSVMSTLMIGSFVLPQLQEVPSQQSQGLDQVLSRILEATLEAISSSPDAEALYECILREVAPYMPALTATDLAQLTGDLSYVHRMLAEISDAFRVRSNKQSSGNRDDLMDLDDEFDTQESRTSAMSQTVGVPRSECALRSHPQAFYADTVQRLYFYSVMFRDPGQIGLVSMAFLDDFLALSDEEILSCRYLVRDLFDSDLIVSPDDAYRVAERLGMIMTSPGFSSCEVALITCLDMMCGFMSIWSDTQGGGDLATLMGDLYVFFMKNGLSKNLLSPRTQMSLARMLFHLTQMNEKFPETVKQPTTTVSLLSILENGTIPVKFYIGGQLPSMFSRYILKVHDDLFVDVLAILPTDPEVEEGIAFRLFALAELAREWPTLLRRCVYHIFETPGNIPYSATHAAQCLRKISNTLKLPDPEALFDLFAPQLLYTWLESSEVENIPYQVFGFNELNDLLRHAQSEVVALMVMRGQDEALAKLATTLKTNMKGLLDGSFSKAVAYSMAHDISVPKSESQPSGESRMRKALSRETFLENIYFHFADIIGLFFSLIEQEEPVEKWWAKDDMLAYAVEAMAEIKKCGHSDAILVANQQPTFRAKYLTREISLLCSRTDHEVHTLWTPSLVVAVARKLLSGVSEALGPLHACAVLRKIRVLICLAGAKTWEPYPLEMLLHSIRPFIVNSECADDALGMSRYLLQRGQKVLTKSPSFLAGYALSTLASLRVFLETSQSSTTQESQFKATMTKAQQFHTWFTRYLEEYRSPLLKNEKQENSFRIITQSAAYIRSSGNAERESHESRLLLEILRDDVDGAHLLNESSRKLALGLLCGSFRIPDSVRNDVVGSDDEARHLATAVWKSCQASDLSDEYWAWAGRVVGRGFAASGHVDQDLLRESALAQYKKRSAGDFGSLEGIISLVQSLTTDSDQATAGMAESALRVIVSEAIVQEDTGLSTTCQNIISDQLFTASNWAPYQPPPSDMTPVEPVSEEAISSAEAFEQELWPQRITVHLAQGIPKSIVLTALLPMLSRVKGFAQEAFPYILHLVLLLEREYQQRAKRTLSTALKQWFKLESHASKENMKLMLNAILYLRTQRLPGESSIADRTQWLDIDLQSAASAASRWGMYKTSLLLIESISSEGTRSSRRSSTIRAQESTDVLLDIFENIDDPDAYYGLNQTSDLSSVLSRLEYEKDSSKSVAFRGAQYDSHIRRGDPAAKSDSRSLIQTLNSIGLSGLSHSLLQSQQNLDGAADNVDSTFNTARRLEVWNLPAPTAKGNSAVALYKAYQSCNQATEIKAAQDSVYGGLSHMMNSVIDHEQGASHLRRKLGALASLTELDDVLNISNPDQFGGLLTTFEDRAEWMRSGRYEDVSQILSCRETSLAMLTRNEQLRGLTSVRPPEVRLTEVKSMLLSSGIYRYHQATQESLNIVTSLTDLIQPSADLGLVLEASAKMETANSLWDHGEMMPSIRMLQTIEEESSLHKQTIPVSRPDLLAKIGHQVSVARLEKPDTIQKSYLQPALKELRGKTDGNEAGKVYHQFAVFCDEQLQSPDSLEDLARLQHLRRGKSEEVEQLKRLVASAKESQLKHRYQSHLQKAKQWLELDEQELRRVEQSRSEFVKLSLDNYLLSLSASDQHNNDALRFTALWLERSADDGLNKSIHDFLLKVPTRKFAPLMNQLSSRLLDQNLYFQRLLLELIYRICVDHPYHGMYQIWSGTKTRTNKEDEVAVLRQKATDKVGKRLAQTDSSSTIWTAISQTSKMYHALAMERDASRYKAGQKINVKDSQYGANLAHGLTKYHIPPPTMQIELSSSRDYSHVPYIAKLDPTMSIASGVSAPKIITAIGSNGARFKQLVKGGNDDLRQDAIMEQVFSAVSDVLKLHRTTRQRNLGIRTYKVLPLTSASGLIEFVPDTIPLHEYLMPAHERYHPKDYKGNQCRKEISSVQGKSSEVRLSTYKKVTDRFQPVMRYFFMEYFVDPDDWFAKRTAYTRTTAAISILGHILGLGDRHGHNILLDSQTGEVVHIDLGVAFEMGRVLPVPELVPFRLTRDIVDGMGTTRTEGVFRRCCEFTLDALREETYSIMTILDVLRYDPLYSWSISPVRMAKLQDLTRRAGEREGSVAPSVSDDVEVESSDPLVRRGGRHQPQPQPQPQQRVGLVNEPSEADRALEVVRKKLSKTLSVTATVNDLINQATDEKNLAVLYSGWAAYA